MTNLPGMAIHKKFLPDLQHVDDLIYFEGPLLSEFRSVSGEPYIYRWCDVGDESHRWLIFRVRERALLQFKAGMLSHRDLIQKEAQGNMFLADMDGDGEVLQCSIVLQGELPSEYLPKQGTFLKLSARQRNGLLPVFLDGKWSIEDLPSLFREFSSAYAINYVTTDEKMRKAKDRPLQGGFSYMHFWNELKGWVPPEQRADVKAVQYHSPGYVEFSGHSHILQSVANSVASVLANDEALKEIVAEQSVVLSQYSVDEDELGEVADEESEPELAPEDAAELVASSKAIFDLIGVIEWPRFQSMLSNPSPLKTAKLTRSYLRRLQKLARYQRDGRAVIAPELEKPLTD